MMTAGQLRAARALIGIDQKTLADAADVSVQTIQRMEASDNLVRGVVDSLAKVIAALERLGIELINEDAVSAMGGRGIRLKIVSPVTHKARNPASMMTPKRVSLLALEKRRPKNG